MNEQPNPFVNIEAEQLLIGAVLVHNAVYFDAAQILEAQHFGDPVHAEIWQIIGDVIGQDREASPATIRPYIEKNERYSRDYGQDYLGKLSANAFSVVNANDYASAINDLWRRRQLVRFCHQAEDAASNPTVDETAGDLVQRLHADMDALGLTDAGRTRTWAEIVQSMVDMAHESYNTGGKSTYVPSGIPLLDDRIGGFPKRNMTVIGARPAMGKTGLLCSCVLGAAKQGYHTAVASVEMSAEDLVMRLACQESGLSIDAARRGRLSVENLGRLEAAARQIETLPIEINDDVATAEDISYWGRSLKTRNRLDIIWVDYLQFLRMERRRGESLTEATGKASGLLADFAKRNDVPLVLLSQLSRQVEGRDDKRPVLSDLRDSGNIEQDAALVFFIFREAYYLSQQVKRTKDEGKRAGLESDIESLRNTAELVVAKNRHGQADMNLAVGFEPKTTGFYDLANPNPDFSPDDGQMEFATGQSDFYEV